MFVSLSAARQAVLKFPKTVEIIYSLQSHAIATLLLEVLETSFAVAGPWLGFSIASRKWFRAKTPVGPLRRPKNGVSELGPKHHEAFHDEAPVGPSPTFSEGSGQNLESGGQGNE